MYYFAGKGLALTYFENKALKAELQFTQNNLNFVIDRADQTITKLVEVLNNDAIVIEQLNHALVESENRPNYCEEYNYPIWQDPEPPEFNL